MRYGSAPGRIYFYQDAMGAGASRMHDQHLRRIDDISLLVPALPLRSWQRPLFRPWMGARALLRDSDPARNSGRSDRAARAQDDVARAPRQLPAPSANRAMDLAAMDVRVGNRRDRLLHAVSTLPADLSADVCACSRSGIDYALKKRKEPNPRPLPLREGEQEFQRVMPSRLGGLISPDASARGSSDSPEF